MQQKSSQRHKTSVFTEYENNSNNSITSKQLEYWLLQMAPTSHTSPKFGNDWNLMSTSSRYQPDGITFGQRQDTFQSANKQNIMSHGNLLLLDRQKQHHQSLSQKQPNQKAKSNKSYINAMQDLQKRAKTLQQQNMNMRRSIQFLQQQKRSTLQQSMVQSQEIKSKTSQFQQIQKRAQQIRRQNKKLRDCKNEQSGKLKLMQKSINEQKLKVKSFEERLDMLSLQNQHLKKQLSEANNMTKSLMVQNKQLSIKTDMLENMKQKSTTSIMEKYAKALQRIEELEIMSNELRNKSFFMEEKSKKNIAEKEMKYFKLLQEMNQVKLQKELISVKLQKVTNQGDEKNKTIIQLESHIKKMEYELKQVQVFKKSSIQSINKGQKRYQKCMNEKKSIEKKFDQVSKKYKEVLKKYNMILHNNELISKKDQTLQPEKEQDIYEKSSSRDQSEYEENQQENNTEKLTEKSQHLQYQNQHIFEIEKSAKPLSIVIDAKHKKALIKSQNSEINQLQQRNEESNMQESDRDSLSNERQSLKNKNLKNYHSKQRIQMGQKQGKQKNKLKQNNNSGKPYLIVQKNKNISKSIISQQKSSTESRLKNQSKNKQKGQSVSQQKNTSNKSQQRKNKSLSSLKQSKLINVSTNKQNNHINKSILKSSNQSQEKRSNSSSLNKKSNDSSSTKKGDKKSVSMDSKDKSLRIVEQTNANTTQRQQRLIRSSQPSQSRYIISEQKYINQHQHKHNSAGVNRYNYLSEQKHIQVNNISSNGKQNYMYKNQINTPYHPQHPHPMYHQSINQSNSFHQTSLNNGNNQSQMMHLSSQKDQKSLLNKAILFEYQKQAYKLYSQNQKLVQILEDQNLSNQQRSQTLGRLMQVMSMIDHNTEKIFSIKGSEE